LLHLMLQMRNRGFDPMQALCCFIAHSSAQHKLPMLFKHAAKRLR
jgi:hypothetical protein